MLRTFLESVGHNVTVCLDGSEVIEAFENKECDLAVVDIGMPEVDGWEVSRRINELRPEVPIIVATGWNMTVEDGRDVGATVDSVLRKPSAMADLIEAVDHVTGRRRTGSGH
jgi:CheY-like chemotaxis protein